MLGSLAIFGREWRPANLEALLSDTVSIAGIAAGFLISGQTLLIGLTDNRVVRFLRDVGRFGDVLRYFSSALWWCVWLVAATLSLRFIGEPVPDLVFAAWVGLMAGAAGATIRILVVFQRILEAQSSS
ncbi:MAG TPA: hypothetical protein PKC18_07730 [Lacipirellulaceae bacterium]|nr:hypothetical protein [Verrucomicrobiota bacterium]HMO84793.1 hypothetical protein [Lacipirellulaceae bacterium]